MRDRVFETLRLAASELKSDVSTNSTNPAYRGSVYTNGFLKVWLGIPASNRNWGSQSPFCYHYNNPQYTNRFIHPTYGNRYGLWGFRRQSWISTSAYTANAREASSSCTISLILDVTLPTRLGLRPIALHTYLFLPQQHYIFCPSVYPTFSEHGHRPSRSLWGLWVNPFSRWAVRLYCHNQLCVPTC